MSKGGVLKYSYILPKSMTFPVGSTALIVFSDRAGGVYELGDQKLGSISADRTTFTWLISEVLTNQVAAGDNFEVFINIGSDTYKVRYGRVVRKQVSYPLNPISVAAPPLMYEDDLQRNVPGPRWLVKHGGVSMQSVNFNYSGQTPSSVTRFCMASRNAVDVFGNTLNLFSKATVQWYAPMQSDEIEILARAVDVGDGDCTFIFASNSSMSSWLGVRITDPNGAGTDFIQVVRGTSPVPPTFSVFGGGAGAEEAAVGLTRIGSTANFNTQLASAGATSTYTYKIVYSGSAKTVTVFTPASTTTAALTTSLASTAGIFTGAGYRYTGLMFNGSLVTTGPKVFYWKAKDIVA